MDGKRQEWISAELWDAAVDRSLPPLPPGVFALDGWRYPIVEFDV